MISVKNDKELVMWKRAEVERWFWEKIYRDVERAMDLVLDENYEVEEAVERVFGKGFREWKPEYWNSIVEYMYEVLRGFGRKKAFVIKGQEGEETGGVKGMTWREIKKVFPQAERFSKEFEQVFNELGKDISRDKLTVEDIDKVLGQRERFKGKYPLTYTLYGQKGVGWQKWRDVEQLVMQINFSADIKNALSGIDPRIQELARVVADLVPAHPGGPNVIGWFRLDRVVKAWDGEDVLLLDEIQSDFLKVLYELGFKSEEDMSPITKSVINYMDKNPEKWKGIDFQQVYKMVEDKIKDWRYEGIAALLEIARRNGIKYVALHTEESMRMKGGGAVYVKSMYKDLVKRFGFKEMDLTLGGKTSRFFVREAGVRRGIKRGLDIGKEAEIVWSKKPVMYELIEEFTKGEDDEVIESVRKSIMNSLELYDDGTGWFSVDGVDYMLVENEEKAIELAVEEVMESLKDDPMGFGIDFIGNYVKVREEDKDVIISDEESVVREELLKEEYGVESEDELSDEEKEEFEEIVEERMNEFKKGLDNPVEYFVHDTEIYTLEELLELPWIVIDYDKAVEDIVSADGWEGFLSTYDGEVYYTRNGLLYFRV